jgi:uncharacterized protein (UPF0548 family)
VHDTVELGVGDEVFGSACGALREWAAHRGSGVAVVADGPLATGTNVALGAPLPVGTALATCRVTAVIDEPARFGFTYTTLPTHPARGAERFLVESHDGIVTFTVEAVSTPNQWFARIAPPVTRWFQRRATRAYLDALRAALRS